MAFVWNQALDNAVNETIENYHMQCYNEQLDYWDNFDTGIPLRYMPAELSEQTRKALLACNDVIRECWERTNRDIPKKYYNQ